MHSFLSIAYSVDSIAGAIRPWLVLPCLGLLVATLIVYYRWRPSSIDGIPVVSVGMPVLGNLFSFLGNPIVFVRTAEEKCGPIFRFSLFHIPVIYMRDPALNRAYLDTSEEIWSFGDPISFLFGKLIVPGFKERQKPLLGILNRSINRPATLRCYAKLSADEARKLLGEWEAEGNAPIFQICAQFVHRVIVRCLMGQDFYDHHRDELYDLLRQLEVDISNPLSLFLPSWIPFSPSRRIENSRKRAVRILKECLRIRQQEGDAWKDSPDYISHTLREHKRLAELGDVLIAHHVLIMFAAFTSTTANIAWTILELARSPGRMKRLKEELSFCDDIHDCHYLTSCLDESSRRYGAAHTFRWTRQPRALPDLDITIPPNCLICISPFWTHNDPTRYLDTHLWMPERWLDSDGTPIVKPNSRKEVAYFPFGAGAHRCPGEALARVMAREFVALLVQQYDLTWVTQTASMELGDLDTTKAGTPWLRGDAMLRVSCRSKP